LTGMPKRPRCEITCLKSLTQWFSSGIRAVYDG
jgi:hypothetical protein